MFYKMLTGLTAITLSLTAGSAFAGPDWALIERARAERKAQLAKPVEATAEKKAGVQPIAHGPRAEFRPVAAAKEAAEPVTASIARQ